MAPFIAMVAGVAAKKVAQAGRAIKVLDVAAGHGMFGIIVAKENPQAEVVATDWANVLEVALGSGYDLILLPNFLHHFDAARIVKFLGKVRGALKPGGVVATVEFVPNEDRVSPPLPASFGMLMLGSTPAGDAYTFREYEQMFREAGFSSNERQALDPTPGILILSRV